ncbi:MAG: InlB B-repeat-containing protein, partial [Bacteroidales bacterium]|nr:InlB B-repeat-containing protein [Bacteroidales bacterium]
GWNTAPDGSGTSYTDSQEITLTEDVTLYAQWKQVKGIENGYEWVDLGLPSGLKWATCNVGATTPDGYGDYFAWGETSPKDNYQWSTYKYCNGSETTLTKYNTKSNFGTVDNKITLDLIDDAARVNWGGKWRMPTTAEQDELINNCTWTWTAQNGVEGYKVASKTNGNSIFLPAAGNRNGTSVVGFSGGFYWSSSLSESYLYSAYRLYFSSGHVSLSSFSRNRGHTVRAVISDDTPQTTIYTLTFNANGGSGTMSAQTFEEGVSQALAANAFTRSGYTFTGWNTKADGSGTSYTDGQELTLTQDIILYAQWEVVATTGYENGCEWVDLGLPSGLKWATCNVGATSPEGYGDYFAWGETEDKFSYSWNNYKYCNGSETTLTKYNTNSNYGIVDNKTTLDLSDDAARANWGGKWRMPTKAEQDELRNNCTWTWTTQNGVNGYKVTSKTNGNSIFLPAAGRRYGTSVDDVGSRGCYWSRSLNESSPYYLYFYSGYVDWGSSRDRNEGHTVRAVCP